MLKTQYFFGCLVIALLLVACKKDATYDVTGVNKIKFFTNNVSTGDAPDNSMNFEVVNIPAATGSGLLNLSATLPDTVVVPVYATRPVSQDVTINAALQESLIADYNAAHNTSYVPFPSNLLNTDDLVAKITAGNSTSDSHLQILTDAAALSSLSENNYMAPIVLTKVSDNNIGEITANATAQVTYITAEVEERLIKYDANPGDAIGTLISNRSPWDLSFTPDPSINGDIIDGSTSTYTRWNESSGQVDINMQSSNDVTGLRLYTSNSGSRLPMQFEVYLSNDGIEYDHVGSPAQSDVNFSSSYNYILFYKPVQAKYLRLKLHYSSSTSSQNRRLAELDVYAN